MIGIIEHNPLFPECLEQKKVNAEKYCKNNCKGPEFTFWRKIGKWWNPESFQNSGNKENEIVNPQPIIQTNQTLNVTFIEIPISAFTHDYNAFEDCLNCTHETDKCENLKHITYLFKYSREKLMSKIIKKFFYVPDNKEDWFWYIYNSVIFQVIFNAIAIATIISKILQIQSKAQMDWTEPEMLFHLSQTSIFCFIAIVHFWRWGMIFKFTQSLDDVTTLGTKSKNNEEQK